MTTLVGRPAVEQRLRDAIDHASLTVLHAPLGAGKTSAVALALRERPNVVWVDARPWHSATFAREIIAAIRHVRDGFGRMTLGALESGSSAAHLGNTFARELAHIDAPLTIVVDNVHLFEDRERFFRFVDAALSDIPDSVRIVAIGRSLPQAPLLRTLARRRIAMLDPDMLRLNDGEMRVFARAFGSSDDDATIARLSQATEGWAAGVVLALTTRGVAFDASARQILSEIGKDELAFLEDAAVYETLDAGVVDIEGHLGELRRRGVLVDETAAGRYRLNPMLREMLLSQLAARNGEARAHSRASAAYANAGQIGAALYHASASADPAVAEALLRSHAEAAVAAGDYDRVESLASLVVESKPQSAAALYALALLAKARGAETMSDYFTRAKGSAAQENDAHIAFAAKAQLLEHDIGMLADVPASALDELDVESHALPAPERLRAGMLRGWWHAVRFEFEAALQDVAPYEHVDDNVAQFNVGILRAYALTGIGNVDASQRTLDALISRFETSDAAVLQSLTLLWFARLATLWGTTTAASEAVAEAQRLASALELRSDEPSLLITMCELATHHGDIGTSIRYAQQARAAAGRAWYAADRSRIQAFSEIALARAAFLGHDNAIARDLSLRAAGDPATPSVQRATALSEAAIYTLLCEPFAAAGVIERARTTIAEAMPLDAADAIALATCDDILAFLDAANGQQHEPSLEACSAFSTLLARRRGLVTLELAGVAVGNARKGLAESTAAFDTAIAQVMRDGPRFEAHLARAYASTFIKTRASALPAVDLPELTSREREILTLLVEGLSNKEIAQRLVVSPRTIETHVERVLGKLGVGSRSRAIAKAVRMGLVPLEG